MVLNGRRKNWEIFDNCAQLLFQDLSLGLLIHAFEGRTHERNHHIEDHKEWDQSSHEEDDPEDDDIFSVFNKASCDLKVTNWQSVRVNKAPAESIEALVFFIFRVLVKNPEKQHLWESNEEKHTA